MRKYLIGAIAGLAICGVVLGVVANMRIEKNKKWEKGQVITVPDAIEGGYVVAKSPEAYQKWLKAAQKKDKKAVNKLLLKEGGVVGFVGKTESMRVLKTRDDFAKVKTSMAGKTKSGWTRIGPPITALELKPSQ